jgi:hypothetical protein
MLLVRVLDKQPSLDLEVGNTATIEVTIMSTGICSTLVTLGASLVPGAFTQVLIPLVGTLLVVTGPIVAVVLTTKSRACAILVTVALAIIITVTTVVSTIENTTTITVTTLITASVTIVVPDAINSTAGVVIDAIPGWFVTVLIVAALRVLITGTAVRSTTTWLTRADKVSINLTVLIGVAKVTTIAIIVVLTVARLRLHGDTTEELRYLQSRGGVGSYAEDGKEECDLHDDDFSW